MRHQEMFDTFYDGDFDLFIIIVKICYLTKPTQNNPKFCLRYFVFKKKNFRFFLIPLINSRLVNFFIFKSSTALQININCYFVSTDEIFIYFFLMRKTYREGGKLIERKIKILINKLILSLHIIS